MKTENILAPERTESVKEPAITHRQMARIAYISGFTSGAEMPDIPTLKDIAIVRPRVTLIERLRQRISNTFELTWGKKSNYTDYETHRYIVQSILNIDINNPEVTDQQIQDFLVQISEMPNHYKRELIKAVMTNEEDIIKQIIEEWSDYCISIDTPNPQCKDMDLIRHYKRYKFNEMLEPCNQLEDYRYDINCAIAIEELVLASGKPLFNFADLKGNTSDSKYFFKFRGCPGLFPGNFHKNGKDINTYLSYIITGLCSIVNEYSLPNDLVEYAVPISDIYPTELLSESSKNMISKIQGQIIQKLINQYGTIDIHVTSVFRTPYNIKAGQIQNRKNKFFTTRLKCLQDIKYSYMDTKSVTLIYDSAKLAQIYQCRSLGRPYADEYEYTGIFDPFNPALLSIILPTESIRADYLRWIQNSDDPRFKQLTKLEGGEYIKRILTVGNLPQNIEV